MIEIPVSPDHAKNAAKCKGKEQPCVCCGKPVKNPKHHLHLHCGGSHAVFERETEDLPEEADLGLYPIGTCCLRKHPELKPYVDDAERPGKPNPDNAGLKLTRWHDACKTWVSVYDGFAAEMTSEKDARWMLTCERHSVFATFSSFRLAKWHLGGTPMFCERCADEMLWYCADLQEKSR